MNTLYEKTLLAIAERDRDVVVMTAENRAALRSLPPLLGDRFVDVGIAEQTMLGMAAGMALRGRKPVVHALAAFLTLRAFEFVRTDVGIGRLPVKLVGYVPGFLSDGNGPTHQAIEDVAIMRGIPGMKVFCPADEEELATSLPRLLDDPAPCYIRYTGAPAAFAHPIPEDPARIEVVAEGGDVAILTHGLLIVEALEARRRLGAAGIGARVLNVRMPKPIDADAVLAAARGTALLVTLEDHFRVGGLYSIVCELLVERGVTARVLPIALDERWFRPAMLGQVLEREGFNGAAVAARIQQRLDRDGLRRPSTMRPAAAPEPSDPMVARSEALWARSQGLIPAGTQTLAKGPGQYVDGVAPKYLLRGRGVRVRDVDGNEYVDWTMGVGPLVLGYGHPAVDDAIRRQLEDGITFSLMHPLEVEVAELVRAVVPGAQSVRYSKTGCDVTSAAVRLARAFTGRERVVCCGYHGWHDWYISVTDRNRGIPRSTQDLVSTFDYNDLDSAAAAIDEETACVILEPQVVEAPRPGFLAGLRSLCDRAGALLVFDEMWTGFRLALGGAQEHHDTTADLACFSKAVANGMPLALLTGRRDVMALLDRDVFFFTTFGGEALSLAAARATIEVLRDQHVPARLAERGSRLRDAYNAIAAELGIEWTRCSGMTCRPLVSFDGDGERRKPLEMKSFVQQELIRRGILWTGFHNLSLSHGDIEIEQLLDAYRAILPELARHVGRGSVDGALRGRCIEPVFRKTSHFNTRPRGPR